MRTLINQRIPAAALLLTITAGTALAAGPVYWDWPAGRSFAEMELDGAALDEQGHLVPGLVAEQIGPVGPEVFWRVTDDGDGGFFLGSGHGGEIHHLDRKRNPRLTARLEGTEVFSLLRDQDRSLLAGCGPAGQLYRVLDDGASELLGTVEGGYIWSMAVGAAQNEVWLATGSPAALYRYSGDEGLTRIQVLPAQNALDIVVSEEGEVLIVTQGPGLVFRYRPRTQALDLLFETPQDEVRQFIAGPGGQLHVLALNTTDLEQSATNGNGPGRAAPPPSLLPMFGEDPTPAVPKAAIFRLTKDHRVEPFWSGDMDLMIGAWSETWGWLAGGPVSADNSRTVLHQLTPPFGSHPLSGWQGGDIMDLLVLSDASASDQIVVCQAHPGGVAQLSDRSDSPRLVMSPPLDGGRPVRWGRLHWAGTRGDGRLKWSVRGGNRSVPDASWTAWTDSWSDADHAVELAPCRFLQWRLEFPADSRNAWSVTGVTVSAWQDNLSPVIRAFDLEQPREISLGGLMPRGDNVTQSFRSGLRVEFSRSSAMDRRADPRRAAMSRPVRILSWQASDPNGDRIVFRLEYRRLGDQAWRPVMAETEEHMRSWDTSDVPDGDYELRLTASDIKDNPAPLTLETMRLMGPVAVDNTAPEIADFKVRRTAEGLRISCRAEDEASQLAAASIQLPDGSVRRLDPRDLICDSRTEEFSLDIDWPPLGESAGPSPWRVRVEVVDLAGNLATVEGDVK